MRKILSILALLLFQLTGYSQFSISGKASSMENPNSIAGTTIGFDHSYLLAYCDDIGSFIIRDLPAGKHIITFSNVAFRKQILEINLQSDTTLAVVLEPAIILADEVIISAISAKHTTPVAFSELSKTAVEELNFGKDIPAVLNFLPSVVTTSDAGNSVGYTGIRIRGSDASRINVTVNGVPLNDAESQNVYWVDLPDLATSVENVQVQRGVGTSTNGSGAFGGSINIQTNKISMLPFVETGFAAGSFNTFKNNVSFGSGLLHDHWFMEGRLSKISSDGYIDRASSDLKSFYASAGYAGKNTIARFNILSGKEITYQSWNGVPESRIKGDSIGLQNYILNNYLSSADAENLLNSGRTYNAFTYENQVDNYQQDHYQFLFAHQLTSSLLINTALHYTRGKGYYEEFKTQDKLTAYGLIPVYNNGDTIVTSDLVRRKWLSNDFYGITYSLNYEINHQNKIILGGAWNEYDGEHFNELTWMQWPSGSQINQRYYDDKAWKTDFNFFAKYLLGITDKINIYIDQQYRRVSYHFNGLSDDGSLIPQKDQLNFLNPKAGINITFSPAHSVFVSAGIAQKEPSRDDYSNNIFRERPVSEQLNDYEFGYAYNGKNTTFQYNVYLMDYKNQLVLRGDLNDVGNAVRVNVPKSYRLGLELNAEYLVSKKIKISGNLTASKNKITAFTDQLDNYLDYSKTSFTYENTDIAYSPSLTGMGKLAYTPVKYFSMTVAGKYVGKQYLDNSQNENRKINDYTVVDIITRYKMHFSWLNEITFGVLMNNVLNRMYVSNGYTYGYLYGTSETHENFYYPQAGFNVMAQVEIKF